MRNLLTLFFIASLVWSCTDVIDLDLDDQVRTLAIDGRITDSSGCKVVLSITGNYLEDGQLPRIDDAEVYLFENGTLIGQLQNDSLGLYTSALTGSIGNSYHLEIELPESYGLPVSWKTLKTTMPRMLQYDSLRVEYRDRNSRPPEFTAGSYAVVYFNEPEGVGDYYRIRRWKNDSLITASLFNISDENFDGRSFGYPSDGETDLQALPPFSVLGPIDAGDSISVEISSIPEDFYNYLNLVAEQVFQVGSPFDAPPVEIVGNLVQTNDTTQIGYGYFTASATEVKSVVFEN